MSAAIGPRFSICVPNFNYEKFVGHTLRSVLDQSLADFEIVVSDNASTDKSRDIILGFGDPRISLHVNRANVGFAANLDRAASRAKGELMFMLSSDDLMCPGALTAFDAVYAALGDRAKETVAVSVVNVVDPAGDKTGPQSVAGLQAIDERLWADAVIDERLSAAAGFTVRRVAAEKLLARSLKLLRNPFPFLSTCYPRALYETVEGYGAQRIINPDKWFAYKLLGAASQAIILDRPLFSYRLHHQNQAAQQSQSGALKHLMDQYAITFDLPQPLLAKAGMTRDEISAAFVEQDVALRGFLHVAENNRIMAARYLNFGKAVYPSQAWSNSKLWALRALLLLGPVGSAIARMIKQRNYSAQIARTTPSPVEYPLSANKSPAT